MGKPMSDVHLTEAEIEELLLPVSHAEQEHPEAGRNLADDHVRACPACAARLERYRAADRQIQNIRKVTFHAGKDCPSETIWLELAADLLDRDLSLELLKHTAECQPCAQLLKAAVDSIHGDTPDQTTLLDSSLKEWQQRVAHRLSLKSAPRNKRSLPFLWVIAAIAAALCVTVAGVLWTTRGKTSSDVEHLLAEAYSEDRTMEMRLPFAAHTRLHQMRSGGQGSLLAKPKSFIAAQSIIATHLTGQLKDTQWLLLQGQLDLLDGRYDATLAELDKAAPSQTGASDFHLVHAIALYEKAQALQEAQIYGEAVNEFSSVLRAEPGNPAALFDRGLACEKLAMYECAANDWHHLLEIEKDNGWADEARQRLQAIEKKKISAH
jgi:tetratricopeptide (TPR) repeat protein